MRFARSVLAAVYVQANQVRHLDCGGISTAGMSSRIGKSTPLVSVRVLYCFSGAFHCAWSGSLEIAGSYFIYCRLNDIERLWHNRGRLLSRVLGYCSVPPRVN